jgi:glutaredoxin 3
MKRPLDRAARHAKSLAMAKVEIYVQDFCPYCARAKALLDRKGIAYEEIYAPHGSAERAEAIRRSGGRTTVPQIFIGGQAIGGSDELYELERSGRLDAMLAN